MPIETFRSSCDIGYQNGAQADRQNKSGLWIENTDPVMPYGK